MSQKQHRWVNFRIFSSDKYKQQTIYTRGIMASTIQADFGGGVNVTATTTANGIQYTINLASGASAGPYTSDQLIDVGSGSITSPPPATFKLTYKDQTVATSTNPSDIENGPDIVSNLFRVQQLAEQNLAVAPSTNTADQPNSTTATTPGTDNVENTAPKTTTNPDVSSAAAPAPGSNVIQNANPTPVDPTQDPQLQQQLETAQIDAAQAQIDAQTRSIAPSSQGTAIGLQGAIDRTQTSANQQSAANAGGQLDWRVKLVLSPDADYLYKANPAGILAPLAATGGVIFPYTPAVSVSYAANYDVSSIIHSNYKVYQYSGSSVDQVTITGEFTAQDTFEANYVLAVIHFFRSMTKMFYGQDQNPKPGTPPPVAFLEGYGSFQFQGQPLAITGFNYSLPQEVDYIQAQTTSTDLGSTQVTNIVRPTRLGGKINPGGTAPGPNFSQNAVNAPTYVPTKIQLAITCVPLVSRNQVSNNFSLKNYATGQLLQPQGQGTVGGFW